MKFLAVLLFSVVVVGAVPVRPYRQSIELTEAAKADQVVDLPGLPAEAAGMKQFAGYLPVHGGDRQIFYWFIEAETAPGTVSFL